MKIMRNKVEPISKDVIGALLTAGDVEIPTDRVSEAELDVRAILDQYLNVDEEVWERAKDLVEQRNLPQNELGRVRKIVAEERKHHLGDEGIDWVIDQVLECFMVSPNFDEVYATDPAMRKKIIDVMRRHLLEDDALEQEVRARLKHVTEGTPAWDVEYHKVLREVRKKHGAA